MSEELLPQESIFFPAKDGEPAPLIQGIHVIRQSATGPIYSPVLFHPSQLPDMLAIQELFGGGTYTLQGRAGGRIVGHHRLSLDGEQRSMSGQKVQVAAPIAAATAPSESTSMIAMLMQMMQQNSQMMMQMQIEGSKQNAQMMMGMLQRGDAQQATMIATMAEASRSAQQSQADFFRYLSEMRGKDQSGGGNLAAYKEGLDLGTTITDIVKTQGDSDGGIGASIGAVLQGIQTLQGAASAPTAALALVPNG